LKKLQHFQIKFSISLENCANIFVVGGRKRKPIGFISRRSEVPRSKQEVEAVGITRNEICLYGSYWLAMWLYTRFIEKTSRAIERNYTMSRSKYGPCFHNEAKVIEAKPSKSDILLKKGVNSGP